MLYLVYSCYSTTLPGWYYVVVFGRTLLIIVLSACDVSLLACIFFEDTADLQVEENFDL